MNSINTKATITSFNRLIELSASQQQNTIKDTGERIIQNQDTSKTKLETRIIKVEKRIELEEKIQRIQTELSEINGDRQGRNRFILIKVIIKIFYSIFYRNEIKIKNQQLESVRSELSKISFNPADNHEFLNKALRTLQDKPKPDLLVHSNKNPILNQIVNFGLKGYLHDETIKVQEKYSESVRGHHHSYVRAEQTCKLLKEIVSTESPIIGTTSPEEKLGLIRICQHRNNFFRYQTLFHRFEELTIHDIKERLDQQNIIVQEIQNNIDELNNPSSSKVVSLGDGKICFAIPGGWARHAISFEFRKENNLYFFIIHNKGEQSGDPRLHGQVTFAIGEKNYGKTRVKIQVLKEALKNPEFLSNLISSTYLDYFNKTFVYDVIHNFLIKKMKGKIICSQHERLLDSLYKLVGSDLLETNAEKDIQSFASKIIKDSEDFHSRQRFGTCAESNLTVMEKEMAPSITRRVIKFYILAGLINQLIEENNPEIVREEADLIYRHATMKLEVLQNKLTNQDTNKPLSTDEFIQLEKAILGYHQTVNQSINGFDHTRFITYCEESASLLKRKLQTYQNMDFSTKVSTQVLENYQHTCTKMLKRIKQRNESSPELEKYRGIFSDLEQQFALEIGQEKQDFLDDGMLDMQEHFLKFKKDYFFLDRPTSLFKDDKTLHDHFGKHLEVCFKEWVDLKAILKQTEMSVLFRRKLKHEIQKLNSRLSEISVPQPIQELLSKFKIEIESMVTSL